MTRLDQILLALHVFGVVGWAGGQIAVGSLLTAFDAETDSGARGRLVVQVRRRAISMDMGATLALACGLYWLVKFKVYTQPWMHIKLTLVVGLLALHGMLRAGVKKAGRNERAVKPWVMTAGVVLGLAIVLLAILKVPTRS
jgi:putative membrane protein